MYILYIYIWIQNYFIIEDLILGYASEDNLKSVDNINDIMEDIKEKDGIVLFKE